MAEAIKQERIHIRLDADTKTRLEKAARFVHKSLSEFVLSHALDSANTVIEEHEKINLTQKDWHIFLDALDNPPAPNNKLKEAFKLHKEHVVQ